MAVIAVPTDEDVQTTQNSAIAAQPETLPDDIKRNLQSGGTRGQMLYENHCTSCHESMVYIREKRKAKNYKELTHWASQRADWLKLGWSQLEKQDVIDFLNERFYKYPVTK